MCERRVHAKVAAPEVAVVSAGEGEAEVSQETVPEGDAQKQAQPLVFPIPDARYIEYGSTTMMYRYVPTVGV